MSADSRPPTEPWHPMSALGAACSVGAVIVGTMIAVGVSSSARSPAHPPCEQLPDVAEVQAALLGSPGLTALLEQQGEDVQIQVGRPCEADPVALVEVTYTDPMAPEKIEAVLTQADGFGVPVIVVPRT